MSGRIAHHSLPVFAGIDSRGHTDVALWKLGLAALPWPGGGAEGARCFVQFVGFPRSGHSLLGALIDAHPGATIAHELDAMGLLRAGFGYRRIARLIRRNAAEFARHGKWWNGYRYEVTGAPAATAPPRVIGDKKGDWAARWCARSPGLLDRLARSGAPDPKWLLVTRAPADNIATMTLRRGRVYDRLRIAAARGGAAPGARIAAAQAEGTLPGEVSDAAIADYRALCTAIAGMKAAIPAPAWLEIDHGALTRAPEAELARIAAFLGLEADPDWLRASAALVRPGGGRSRDRLTWRPDQSAAVAALCREFDFLAPHREAA